MVSVDKSLCCCGKCKATFEVEWELEYIASHDRGMGEDCEYSSQIEVECLNCENVISAQLMVVEYPIGEIEINKVVKINDSEGTNNSRVEEPNIEFFDL